MQEEYVFSGFGGQGVMFAGQLLAYTAMDEGLEVTWIPSYGPEMRGGTAHCYVVISDKAIGSPLVKNPKVGLAFNNPSFEKYEPIIAVGGLFVYNASLIAMQSKRDDITVLPIPASDIADKLGNLKLMNMVMLGAALANHPIITVNAIKHGVDAHIPQHRRNLLEANFKALEQGAEFALDHIPV